eukprot:330838-Rhodomonas_salina.3
MAPFSSSLLSILFRSSPPPAPQHPSNRRKAADRAVTNPESTSQRDAEGILQSSWPDHSLDRSEQHE